MPTLSLLKFQALIQKNSGPIAGSESPFRRGIGTGSRLAQLESRWTRHLETGCKSVSRESAKFTPGAEPRHEVHHRSAALLLVIEQRDSKNFVHNSCKFGEAIFISDRIRVL
jgi:hypothetical protein